MGFLRSLDWGNWLYGLLAALIGGGSNAMVGALAVSSVDSVHFGVGTTNSVKVMVILFLFSGGKDFFLYLKQTPLPSKIVTVTTVETVKHMEHPSATITTKVEATETKSGPVIIPPPT